MNLYETDPEFIERFDYFSQDEVVNEPGQQLEPVTRYMAILAALIGSQAAEAFQEILPQAFKNGVTPVMAKEIVYQATDYVGYGRMLPFLRITNAVLADRGVPLPLAGQATTTLETRLEKGARAQAEMFGKQMKEAWKAGHINRWLAANCFGDYYTRTGLTLDQREMITFCFLMAQGGCEPQLTAHAKGNMNMGNDQAFLVRVVSQCLPYIGYPRSLNAIACINQANKQMQEGSGIDPKESLFHTGEPNEAFAQYFDGQSYLNRLTAEGVAIANVTFEPGCRNHWHIHKAAAGGGQILLCTDGNGWYQEWGKAPRRLRPGDVVVIPAGVKHWHGAAKDSWFSHLSVEVPGEKTANEWLEPVDPAAYASLE